MRMEGNFFWTSLLCSKHFARERSGTLQFATGRGKAKNAKFAALLTKQKVNEKSINLESSRQQDIRRRFGSNSNTPSGQPQTTTKVTARGGRQGCGQVAVSHYTLSQKRNSFKVYNM